MPTKRKRPLHDSDYDGAWKQALLENFAWFLRVYFPAVCAEMKYVPSSPWSIG